MQPDSHHAKAPGLRPRTFALPQTTDARWLPIHLHAVSSTLRWRDPARQRHRIAAIPISSSPHLFFRGLRLGSLHKKTTGFFEPGGTKEIFPQWRRMVHGERAYLRIARAGFSQIRVTDTTQSAGHSLISMRLLYPGVLTPFLSISMALPNLFNRVASFLASVIQRQYSLRWV